MDSAKRNNLPSIAIVVPCYNEQECLPSSNRVLTAILDRMIEKKLVGSDSCILYVNDGSSDSTWELIKDYASASQHVRGISLAGNAGHQNALIAGLEAVSKEFDAVISIDADLQDDVEVIPQMVERYRDGYDIVFGVREDRSSDSWFKRESAQTFYNVQRKFGVKTVYNHADFRLMSRSAVEAFLDYGERNMFIRGIVAGMGFRQTQVYYTRIPRQAGVSKYPLRKMLNFAVDGITSFSVRPVRMVFFVGLIFMIVATGIFVYTMIRYFGGHTIEGWTSMILSIWFCSGIVLISLGVIGEYIGKIYIEVKHRPRYVVKEKTWE